MKTRHTTRAGLLLGCFLALAATTMAAEMPPLTSVLHELPRDRLLEISLDDGSVHVGYLGRVRVDSLTLLPRDENPETTLAVNEVIRIREKVSNAGRGAGWGAVSGSLIGGGLGFLSGLYLASINDSGEGDAGPVIGGTLVGAAMGAGTFALTGLGIGALTRSWRTVWGPDDLDRVDSAGHEKAPVRLDLDAGWGWQDVKGIDFDGFAWRLGLLKPISPHLEMGPHFGFVHTDGSVIEPLPGGGTQYTSNDNHFHASFGAELHLRDSGFGPYAALGTGWYWGNGSYLGGHVGGGLRHQNHHGTEFSLDIRWHFNITEIDKGAHAGFMTAMAGFSFDL